LRVFGGGRLPGRRLIRRRVVVLPGKRRRPTFVHDNVFDFDESSRHAVTRELVSVFNGKMERYEIRYSEKYIPQLLTHGQSSLKMMRRMKKKILKFVIGEDRASPHVVVVEDEEGNDSPFRNNLAGKQTEEYDISMYSDSPS